MESQYYHGLAGGIPFWEEKAVLDESIRTLNLILKLGGICCRKDLKQHGIEIFNEKQAVYNGDDYISICIDNPTDEEFVGENFDLDPSFFRYAKTKIAIKLKSSIVETCTFREEPYKRLPGERQIYRFIDISNFECILIGLEDLKYEAVNMISKICKSYGIPVMTFEDAKTLEDKKLKKVI